MTWVSLIPAAIGLLTALALVMRATPQVFTSIAKAIDAHSDVYRALQKRLDDCEKKHDEQQLRIEHLEAQCRADADVIDRAFEALGISEKTITAMRAEAEQLRRAIQSGDHHTTTHRGTPR